MFVEEKLYIESKLSSRNPGNTLRVDKVLSIMVV